MSPRPRSRPGHAGERGDSAATQTEPSVSILGSPAMRAAFLFVWVTGVLQTIRVRDAYDDPWLVAIGLALVLGAMLLTSRRTSDPMPPVAAWQVAGVLVVGTALVLVQLDPADAATGTWVVQVGSYMCGFVIVRRRLLPALVGIGLTLVLIAWWAFARRAGFDGAATVASRPVAAGAVGVLWWSLLERSIRRIRRHRSEAWIAAVGEEAAQLAILRSAADLRAIERDVAPILARLQPGADLDAASVAEIERVEALIRQRIRAPRLAVEPLLAAAGRARARGVDVLLLDDSGMPAVPLDPADISWLAAVVDGLGGGQVTVRLLPQGRRTVGTVVVDDGSRVWSETFGEVPGAPGQRE